MKFFVRQPLSSPKRSSTTHPSNGRFSIQNNKALYNIEAIFKTLPISPSTYYLDIRYYRWSIASQGNIDQNEI